MKLRYASPLVALLVALLAGCGQQETQAPTAAPTAAATDVPAAAPTAAATQAPALTVTPVAEAVPTAAADAALPQPLYILLSGQLFRIEADGNTRTQITYEVPFRNDALAITEFAVSPAGNALAYIVQREGPPVLVRSGLNGEDPAPIFDRADVGVSNIRFSPDGQTIAASLWPTADSGSSFTDGLYLIPTNGGEPRLVAASDPIVNPETPAFANQPQAFSPDGRLLLTNRFSRQIELCDLAVVDLADGTVTPLQVPSPTDGQRASSCYDGAWATDSSAIYFTPYTIGAPAGAPAIWEANPTTGESRPITPTPGVAPFTLYAFPFVAADGELRAFTTQVDELPKGFDPQQPTLSYTMVRYDRMSGDTTALRSAEPETPSDVRWNPEGSGAVALLLPEIGDPGLFWLPANGGEPRLLLGATTDLSGFVWAP